MQEKQRGFTLIEALIYIALFALIIGGGLIAAYQLIEGTARIENKTITEAEANFLLRKFDWALNSGVVMLPVQGDSGNTLNVWNGGNLFEFTLDGDVVTIENLSNADPFLPLSSGRVVVSDLEFEHVAAVGDRPPALEYSFKVNGEQFGPAIRYIR